MTNKSLNGKKYDPFKSSWHVFIPFQSIPFHPIPFETIPVKSIPFQSILCFTQCRKELGRISIKCVLPLFFSPYFGIDVSSEARILNFGLSLSVSILCACEPASLDNVRSRSNNIPCAGLFDSGRMQIKTVLGSVKVVALSIDTLDRFN